MRSSTNSSVLDVTLSGISLITRTEVAFSDVAPSTITCCLRFVKKDLIKLCVWPLIHS